MTTAEILTVTVGTGLFIANALYTVFTFAMQRTMKQQSDLQKRVTGLQVFQIAIQRMEDTRRDRQRLRDYLASRPRGDAALPDEVRDAADRVCRDFDILALLDRTGFVDQRLVDSFYSVPFVLLYDSLLGPYVADLRKPEKRGPTHFWELVQFYERVKDVPKNHPAVTGEPDWQDDPRLSHAK